MSTVIDTITQNSFCGSYSVNGSGNNSSGVTGTLSARKNSLDACLTEFISDYSYGRGASALRCGQHRNRVQARLNP